MTPPRTTGAIAEALGATLEGPSGLVIERLATLEHAAPGAMTFIRSERYAAAWPKSRATAALVSRGLAVPGHDATSRALLVVNDADLALVDAINLFSPPGPPPARGVHPTATIHPEATLEEGVSIGPGCSIDAGAVIGAGAVLAPNVVIGRDVRIGARTILHSGTVVLDHCTIGEDCQLHPGVVIGTDGFGYRSHAGGIVKIPHIGTVRVGDRVEIGANTCIDRGKLSTTTIGDETKIDNLVQIGHNATIGVSCLICGNAGLAGSVTLGDRVTIAGGVGIADNVTVGEGATIAARSGVLCDVPPGETWGGIPAAEMRTSSANYAAFRSLAEHMRSLKKLIKRVDVLEERRS